MLCWLGSIFRRSKERGPVSGPSLIPVQDRRDPQKTVWPQLGKNVFLASTASVVGDVKLGRGSSVWFNTVIRGDVCSIEIGQDCNIQDGTIIHGSGIRNSLKGETSDLPEKGVKIADRVSLGHACLLHGCEIGEETLIGMGSILMDGVKIGRQCLIGAGTLLTENTQIEDGMLVLGRPGKVIRALTEKEKSGIARTSENYLLYKTWYKGFPKENT